MQRTPTAGAISRERLQRGYTAAREALLAELTPAGHWEGELSTSALSTATAVTALEMVRRQGSAETVVGKSVSGLIDGGLRWLAVHQNEDGGWGDTVKSFSNISTTMLCRAVFFATGQVERYRSVVDAAGESIDRAGGVPALVARYGRDKTFSVPILTHCALAGLVDWSEITPLPFEYACLPARFYKAFHLRVVSYALPALIAIGQARHYHRPTRNPLTRLARNFAREPSLRVLERIQPAGGGFLEATPLTSFVTMSLASMGLADHPVTQRGAEFIARSVRPDGSWPIDTNLATWVTTLSVNALGEDLPTDLCEPILRWLLDQQYKTVHPYTNADPGGWAWTDLPGGVPDADDTAGAILAILELVRGPWSVASGAQRHQPFSGDPEGNASLDPELTAAATQAVHDGVRWLLDLQNRDGGWPTFCRGWGKLPFDRSASDITAHVLRAVMSSTGESGINEGTPDYDLCKGATLSEVLAAPEAIRKGASFLKRSQRGDGSWLPLWFGNQHANDDENPTYGTSRVLSAYRAAESLDIPEAVAALNWLRSNQNADGGWGAGAGTPSSVEETALAVEVLLADPGSRGVAERGLNWLLDRVDTGTWREPAPIGFYFARLWYFERLYPLIFTVGALRAALRCVDR